MSLDMTDFPPSVACICGSRCFKVLMTFDDDGSIGTYSADAYCHECGAYCNTPPPKED